MSQSLQRSTPEQQGISSQAILDFVNAAERELHELHSFMLLRRGAVVAEGWWEPYDANSPHMLYSLSKSFTAAAVGLAVAEDRLAIDDPVIAFFPEDLPAEVSPNLAAMRVRHLLSMSTGHPLNTSEAMTGSAEKSWERIFFEQPVEYAPGTHFVYNNGATYMLSSIVSTLTGQPVIEYLRPRLFEPLGIENPTWEANRRGINLGYKGLKLKTEDIARFGQLYLNRGVWQGKRILPEAWVALASAKHVDNRGDGSGPVDWAQGYGFQFWRCQHNAYRGDGAFGQYCVVMPDQEAVLAMTGGMAEMQPTLDLVWRYLLPAMDSAATLPASECAQELAARLANLRIAPPRSAAQPGLSIDGRRYRLDENYLRWDRLAFNETPEKLVIGVRSASGNDYQIACGREEWQRGAAGPLLPLTMEMMITTGADETDPRLASQNAAASAAWTASDQLLVTLRFYETPYVQTISFTFAGERLTIDSRLNVSFGPTEGPPVIAMLEEAAA